MASRSCYLKDCLGERSFSGRGGNAKMHRSNPFLFAVQVMLGMLLSSAGLTSGNSSMNFRRLPTNTGHTWPYNRAPDGVGGHFPASSATSSETMTSRSCYLIDCLGEGFFSGRDGNAKMHRSNPFLFAVQVMLGMLLFLVGLTSGNSSMDFRRLPTNTGHTWPSHQAPDGGGGHFPASSATSS
ncbi:hypothetical protein MRX96_007002 [Rhipicephalus microplus]